MTDKAASARIILLTSVLVLVASDSALLRAQTEQAAPKIGANYSGLDERRRKLVDDWVARFNQVAGQKTNPASFYDTQLRLSTKTTFDAVTNALMSTTLTDRSGQRFGDALDIVERVNLVRGQVNGASGDAQFRMYAQLKAGAIDMLERSREFRRSADNTVYHHGYPTNYRQQGGAPSVQVSIASDRRRADIDVDYRTSMFPISMFNGHLTSSNSDVRAGSNYDRHINRWAGFENWWRGLFGIRVNQAPASDGDSGTPLIPDPRIGDKTIDLMMEDFLKAWLVDGDIPAAMGYISARSLACVAEDSEDPLSFDRGTAPFVLFKNLKAAHEALGPRTSVDGLTVGVRLNTPGLRLVKQPRHAQYVIYGVPDDIAAKFDCESRLSLRDARRASRVYGNYFGSTFYINTPDGKGTSLALLWARERGYWKIVSWQAEPDDDALPATERAPEVKVQRVKADATFVQATRTFLEAWLIRKNYEEASKYLSPRSYACYNLVRNPEAPAAASPEDAAQKIRAGIEAAGQQVGKPRSLDDVLEGVEPIHAAVRVMAHSGSRTFALSSVPDALADAVDCDARARGQQIVDVPPVYGNAFGMNVRFRLKGGEAPVLRTIWKKEDGAWRIFVYDIETP